LRIFASSERSKKPNEWTVPVRKGAESARRKGVEKNTTTPARRLASPPQHHHPASADLGTPPQLRRGGKREQFPFPCFLVF